MRVRGGKPRERRRTKGGGGRSPAPGAQPAVAGVSGGGEDERRRRRPGGAEPSAEPALRHRRGGRRAEALNRRCRAGRAPAHGRNRARRQPRARRRPERGLAAARRGYRAAGARPPGTHPARSAGAGSPAGSAAASFVCVRGAAAGGRRRVSPAGCQRCPRGGGEGKGREGRRRGKALAGRLSPPQGEPGSSGGGRHWKAPRGLFP